MKTNPYYEINAFIAKGLKGNPAGVCPLEEWLEDSQMHDLAKQNNLSETAFFVKENDGYRLRWFTTEREVDLCGHATLASAYVLFNFLGYKNSTIKFFTKSGELLVTKKENDLLELDFPARLPQECSDQEKKQVLSALPANLQVKEIFKTRDIMVVLESVSDVKNFEPDFEKIKPLPCYGLIITSSNNKNINETSELNINSELEYDFTSRFFLPKDAIPEDPVTGSIHCMLVPYWSKILGKNTLQAYQASERGGMLYCINENSRIKIAGKASLYLKGEINF